MADAIAPAAAPAAPAVKSGWKTTELYLAMFACGALTYFGTDLTSIIKTLLANPALPPWVAPLAMLAPVICGGLIAQAVREYQKLRNELKLDATAPDVTAAQQAGDVAAKGSPADVAAQADK